MSAASLRVLRGQIERGYASLETIDTWQTKKLVTPAEGDEARAYWHQLYDPPLEPEPTTSSESSADEQTPDEPTTSTGD